jgi:peptidoglycan/LPS O-acetylase OafA/YrhL
MAGKSDGNHYSDPKRAAVHFPGLNGLRFWAAFAVFLYHVEWFKARMGWPNLMGEFPFWGRLGPIGVICFFSLSGFLITYLLLEELRYTDTVRVKSFYLRRILRIWPLYYFILLIGGVCAYSFASSLGLPGGMRDTWLEEVSLFTFFLPNLAWKLYGVIPFIGPLWSVGVEEQFYLFWPILLRTAKRRAGIAILCFAAVMCSIRFALPWLAAQSDPIAGGSASWSVGIQFFATLKLECMAMGGLGAFLLQRRSRRALEVLHHRLTQVVAFALLGYFVWRGMPLGALNNTVWGILFSVVVVNLATNPRGLLRLDNRVFNYLGRISFGLYVYHSFAIVGILALLEPWRPRAGIGFHGALYLLSFGLTVLLAALSYRFYESPFLRLKQRHTVIASESR